MAVEITEDFIDEFTAEPDPIPGPSFPVDNTQALNALNKTLSQLIEMGDGIAKESGYKGLGKIPPEDYAELAGIVLERNVSSWAIEKGPEVAFASMTLTIIVSNLMDARSKKLERLKAQKIDSDE